jgi:RNA polymerase sigma-70 factor, ECF subfamily
LEDEAAVDRVLAGDTSAFAFIVRRWQGPIVNLAYRFCRDRSRAEDMAQEAFLRAFRALSKWRREAAFSTWLFALATNLFRSQIRRSPPSDALRQDDFERVDPVTLEDVAARQEGADRVHRLVQSLPPKYRDVLILFYFHDMDVLQTARSLELPAGTVKARLSRARSLLRDRLTPSRDSSEPGAANATRRVRSTAE